MLSKASSPAGTRLRRAKSATSVPSYRDYPQPDAIDMKSRQDAIKAARRAFERSGGHGHIRTHYGPIPNVPLKRCNATRSPDALRFVAQKETEPTVHHDTHPKFLFSANHEENIKPRKASLSESDCQNTKLHQEFAPLDEDDNRRAQSNYEEHLATPKQGVRKPRINHVDNSVSASLLAMNNYNALLHDTRESISASDPHMPPYSTSSPSQLLSQTDSFMSAPSGLSRRFSKTEQSQTIDQASTEVRDTCSDESTQHRISSKPSIILSSFRKLKTQNVLRKVQTSVEVDGSKKSHRVTSHAEEQLLTQHVQQRKKGSWSFRGRFQGLFRKPANVRRQDEIPLQQIDASRAYYGTILPFPDRPFPSRDMTAHADASWRRIRLRGTSIGSRVHSNRASMQSDGEVNTIRSRITSWTNTISEENETANRSSLALPTCEDSLNSILLHPSCSVRDKSRAQHYHGNADDISSTGELYNALKHRIAEATSQPYPAQSSGPIRTELGTQLPAEKEESKYRRDRNASLTSGISRLTRATIRTVTPDRNGFFGSRKAQKASIIHDLAIEPTNATISSCESIHQALKRNEPQYDCQTTIPSAEQIAARVEKANERWKYPLSEKRSFILPSSQGREGPHPITKLWRSKSFYKSNEGTFQPPATFLSQSQMNGDYTSRYGAVSPSIYSRTTGFRSPQPFDSVVSLGREEHEESGIATILQSQLYSASTPSKRSNEIHSNKSSSDWKAWLSQEVAELEKVAKKSDFIEAMELGGQPNRAVEEVAMHGNDTTSLSQLFNSRDSALGDGERLVQHEESSLNTLDFRASTVDCKTRSRQISRQDLTGVQANRVNEVSVSELDESPGSCMNERFPMIFTGRKPSQQSIQFRQRDFRRTESSTPPSMGSKSGTEPTSIRGHDLVASDKPNSGEDLYTDVLGVVEHRKLKSTGHQVSPQPDQVHSILPIVGPSLSLSSSSVSPSPAVVSIEARERSNTRTITSEGHAVRSSLPRKTSHRIISHRASSNILTGRQNPIVPASSTTNTTQSFASIGDEKKPARAAKEQRSLIELRSKFKASPDLRYGRAAAKLLEDETIKRISQGPYICATSGSPVNAARANKENSPSGGWQTPKLASRLPEPMRGRTSTSSPIGRRRQSTSGQRMADAFLHDRSATRGRTESPVFL